MRFGKPPRFDSAKQTLHPNIAAIILLVPIFTLALFLLFWTNAIHHDARTPNKYAVSGPLRCSLTGTGLMWAKRPIYKLTNTSNQTLPRVTLMSWSEQNVPVLYVGASAPSNLTTSSPWPNPSITLKPHESLWFVGSLQSPYKLTFMWHLGGRVGYQVYTAASSK